MILWFFIIFYFFSITHARHFDGGTINWAPIDPYTNSSSVPITITQSYSWAYPIIKCANNVPTTTSGRSGENWNLTCVVDCTTDGDYSTKPIGILTDCVSYSTSLGMMSSQRSHNLTLTAGAHFYLANRGSAWVALNYPAQNGLEWSIVTMIDLRPRLDGFINTPPVASVVSPQYAIVNRTIQINIPVSDANTGDDVRCRWSVYTPGYRRRRSDEKEQENYQFSNQFYSKVVTDAGIAHVRKKRSCPSSECGSGCPTGCRCSCSQCNSSLCTSSNCGLSDCQTGPTIATTVPSKTTTTTTSSSTTSSNTITTSTTSTTTTTTTTSVTETTTIDTPGTLKSTSTYPHRQAIDECGDICYPGSVPNGTTLSNCTITFTGLRAGVWYAVAIQVEDFIDSTSTTPMSSVPVQFLIYVLPQPNCTIAPIIQPVNGCLEVQVGVPMNFSLYIINLCNQSIANLSDLIVTKSINGMTVGNLTMSPTNSSSYYAIFTWTPQLNQVGSQQLCTTAYTTQLVRSNQYCVTFTVKTTSDLCVTTTTSTTTTSSTTTTTTTKTTSTSSSSSTSETSTSTSSTTSSSTTSSTTSSSTSSSSTTTSVTTSSTASTTSSTSSSSSSSTSSTSSTTSITTSSSSSTSSSTSSSSTSSTSTTSTTTSTTTSSTSTSTSSTSSSSSSSSTSTTSTTSTTTSVTSTTTTTVTTSTVTTTTSTKASQKSPNWLLILGLSLLALLLAICCACCCLYCFLWGPAARRRRRKKEEDDQRRDKFLPLSIERLTRRRQTFSQIHQSRISTKNYPFDNVWHSEKSAISNSIPNGRVSLSERPTIMTDVEDERIVSSTVPIKRIKRKSLANDDHREHFNEAEDANVKPIDYRDSCGNTSGIQRPRVSVVRVSRVSSMTDMERNRSNITLQETLRTSSVVSTKNVQVNLTKIPKCQRIKKQRPRASSTSNVSVIRLHKSSMEMRSLRDRSTMLLSAATDKPRKGNGVIVKRIPRKLISSQSNIS